MDLFSETIDKLASKRVGALIVFKGNDSLEPFLNGGILLNGLISQPLILSIFDSSSPGHDGAVIIENGIISKFACHLPITKNYQLLAGRGTRHAAGIGLSEKTDALIIVVSEESGKISLVEEGQIETMESIGQFRKQISAYYVKKQPKTLPNSELNTTGKFFKKFLRPAISFLAASIAWYLFAFNPDKIQKTFSVPIVYRYVPDDLKISQNAFNEVKVTLTAFEREFKFLDPGNFRVGINMSDIAPGTQYINLSRENLNIPAKFSIFKMYPTSIKVKIESKSAKSNK